MKLTISNTLLWLIVAVFVLYGLILTTQRAFGNVVTQLQTPGSSAYTVYNFFATSTLATNFATSTSAGTSATSTAIISWLDSNGNVDNGYFVIPGARRVEIYIGHAAATNTSNGITTYTIQVTGKPSPSETDWYNYSKLITATSTNQQTFATLTGTTTQHYSLDLTSATYYGIRCIATASMLNDGLATCSAAAAY
jgi:hypothetical protein